MAGEVAALRRTCDTLEQQKEAALLDRDAAVQQRDKMTGSREAKATGAVQVQLEALTAQLRALQVAVETATNGAYKVCAYRYNLN